MQQQHFVPPQGHSTSMSYPVFVQHPPPTVIPAFPFNHQYQPPGGTPQMWQESLQPCVVPNVPFLQHCVPPCNPFSQGIPLSSSSNPSCIGIVHANNTKDKADEASSLTIGDFEASDSLLGLAGSSKWQSNIHQMDIASSEKLDDMSLADFLSDSWLNVHDYCGDDYCDSGDSDHESLDDDATRFQEHFSPTKYNFRRIPSERHTSYEARIQSLASDSDISHELASGIVQEAQSACQNATDMLYNMTVRETSFTSTTQSQSGTSLEVHYLHIINWVITLVFILYALSLLHARRDWQLRCTTTKMIFHVPLVQILHSLLHGRVPTQRRRSERLQQGTPPNTDIINSIEARQATVGAQLLISNGFAHARV
jgi:hypothetical protein